MIIIYMYLKRQCQDLEILMHSLSNELYHIEITILLSVGHAKISASLPGSPGAMALQKCLYYYYYPSDVNCIVGETCQNILKYAMIPTLYIISANE